MTANHLSENTDVSELMISEVAGLQRPSQVWTIKGLGADAPFPELKEKLMLFGQFVGDWEMDARYPQPDGTEIRAEGEIHFGWILNGRGVQDVWMSKDQRTGRAIPSGTTVRYYDPKIDAWHCVWVAPLSRVVQTFTARKVGDEIILEGKNAEGFLERWIFLGITPDSFDWRAVESRDKGQTWRLDQKIWARRISPEK